MNKKLFVLAVTLLMCLSAIMIIPRDFEVKANPGDGGGGEIGEGIGLDYNFMWNITKELANVTHDKNIYPSGTIPMGRAFATPGDRWTADYISQNILNETLNLEDVTKLQLGPIRQLKYVDWPYTSKLEPLSFSLRIESGSYPYANPIPIEEMFVFQCAHPPLTNNYSFENLKMISLTSLGNLFFGGAYTDKHYNLSCTPLSQYELIIANVTFIDDDEELPENQEDTLFIMNETANNDEKLNDVTNATGVVLINDISRGYQSQNASNCLFPVARVQNTEENFSAIKQELENGTLMLVDNVCNNETLTFTYNLSNGWWVESPDDFIILSAHKLGEQKYFNFYTVSKEIQILNGFFRLLGLGECAAFIVYDEGDTHFMLYSNRDWPGYAYFNGPLGIVNVPQNSPSLPIFSVNGTVGSWLEDHSGLISGVSVSGHQNQIYLEEDHTPLLNPEEWTTGAEAYNVVGNITIDKSPENKIAIISNRYDGWWGETPGDSGAGAGIVL